MKLTGLLLGAGASYDVAMPLAQELTHELKRWLTPQKLRALNNHWRDQGFGYSDDAVGVLSQALDAEGLSYEHIIGNLEVFRDRTPDAGYHGLLAFLSEIVYFLLKERHVKNVGLIEQNIQYLDGITTLARTNYPLWVFSLNHDLIMECFAAHSGIPLKAGYQEETVHLPRYDDSGIRAGELRAHVLRRQQIAQGQLDFFGVGHYGINLLKIHGSLDEFAFNDAQDMLKLAPIGDGVRGVLTTLQIANEQVRYVDPRLPRGYATTPNEIIYRDTDGDMQFLRRTPLGGVFKFQHQSHQILPYEVLQRFDTYLNYVTRLVCIGYGFGDHHVNQSIRNWLERSDDRNITIVDPLCSGVPGFLLHLFHQIEIRNVDATQYLDEIGSVARSHKSELDRRFGTWLRKQGDDAGPQMQRYFDDLQRDVLERTVAWFKTLPFRDGDIDLAAMGMTPDEFLALVKEKARVPTYEESLEAFLKDATGTAIHTESYCIET